MGDITDNFSYYEFRPHHADRSWRPTSKYQALLIKKLAENLQVVREELPPKCYMKITSGVRTLSDYSRLKNAGYRPSKTSDHNCGVSIPLDKTSFKREKFGDTYNFAVGAADVVPVGLSVKTLFNLTVKLVKLGRCDFGQVIYEKGKNGAEWVHFGASIKTLFCDDIVKLVNRVQFLASFNGGKNYQVCENVE